RARRAPPRCARCGHRCPHKCAGISRVPPGSAARSPTGAWCDAPAPGAPPAAGGRRRDVLPSITSTFKAKTVWWFGCASTTSAANGRSTRSTIKNQTRSAIQCATSRAWRGAFPGGSPVPEHNRSLRLQPDDRFAFFRGFLKRPKQVVSIIPSSRFLERRVTRATRAHRAKLIVELGPGTGGTTRALLRAMQPSARLLAIEINPHFVEVLQRWPEPRLIVEHG